MLGYNGNWEGLVDPDARIMTENISAVKETSSDTTVISSVLANYINITIMHGTETQSYKIPVIVDTRNCAAK